VCVSVLLIALLDHILVNAPVLTPLSEGERQVMVSLADDIGPEARVLVLPTDDWAADRSSEWFPALSGLVSVATVQGSEWLPNGEFTRRIDAHDALLNCVYTADTTCLQEWIEGSPIPVDYIYVPQHEAIERAPYVEPGTPACTSIEASIHREGQYRLVLSSPAAHVYAVAPFPAP